MREKSICFFNGNKPWGGGEKWNHEYAKLLRDHGYRVYAVCNVPSQLGDRLEQEHGVEVLRIRLGNLSFLNPVIRKKLKSFFKKNQIDTVVTALPSDLKTGGIAAKKAGVREVVFRRGIALPTRDTALNRYLFRNVITKLICNSEETRRQVLSANPALLPHERTHILYNGFDVAAFDNLQDTPLVERMGDEIVIGNAARLTAQKGQDLLIEAAAILRERGRNIRVLIAGTGELEDELKAKAIEAGVADVVEFLGFTDDIKGFNRSLDIFALPSLWEGFGYAMVEAMTARLPVVAFDANSMPEVVANGKTGLLAAPGDATSLADKLDILITNATLRQELGEAGRQRVIEKFELHRTFAQFERILDA